jgi:hypothetical protein
MSHQALDLPGGKQKLLRHEKAAEARGFFLAMLIGATIFQRFALPFASGKISVCIVWFYGVFAMMLVFRRAVVLDAGRLALYGLFVVVALISTYLNRANASTLGLLLIISVYAPFVLKFELAASDYRSLLDLYQGLILFIVVCGALQFAVQFVAGVDGMFPFDAVLPGSLFTKGYNLRIPVVQGSGIYKSTGLFLLEPSHFSQVCGFAFLIELVMFKRLWRLAAYAAGLVLSFSGTGIMLLLATVPFVLLKNRSPILIILALSAGLVILLLGDTIVVESFASRVSTFSNTQSSAYARFVSPFVIFGDLMHEGGAHLLFGHGAGQMSLLTQTTDFESHDTSWIKLTYEYGILGAGTFMAFFIYALFRAAPNLLLAAALFFLFLVLGGYLVSPYVAVFVLLLGVWPRLEPDRAFSTGFRPGYMSSSAIESPPISRTA